MGTLLLIIIYTLFVSLISFVGIITILLKERLMEKILFFLIAFSAGALIGGAFLHLIPEAVERFTGYDVFLYTLIGFILFLLVEKVLQWRHCHNGKCTIHTFGYMNLFGDLIHNFIDGLIIAASFVISIPLGVAVTLAVALHEIPQELGDFGVLVYSGFKKWDALLMNFMTALTAVIGGIIGYYLSGYIEFSIVFLIPFAGGGFLYIAASDLIPIIREKSNFQQFLVSLGIFTVGILIMYFLR
ncbi:MAG: ZIP family metal transporter [Candidatus Aenigmatarchaeota archaeon]